ncbi:autophagy regulatory protein Atg2, partial [Blumeria hordei DH14]
MTSYFQSYFQASSMPKRLIQYALSQLDILDTETMDLDHLDIAWGKNSVFEFKNVGLRLKKLEKFLQLPECFKFSKAKIELLRLTIPMDIYSSSVMVEIEGVEIQAQLKPRTNEDHCNHGYLPKKTQPKHLKKQLREDINKLSKNRGLGDENYSEKSYIFNATNLAQSFLQIESEERKLELEAAVLSDIRSSGTLPSLNDDEIAPVWTGAPMALPKFMARFLQGMIDRLQIRIRDIDVSLNVDIQYDGSKPQPPFEAPDPVTIRLRIMKIDVEGVTHNLGKEDESGGANGSKNKPGARLVCLTQIQGFVKSEDNTFSALASPSSYQSYSNLDPSCNIFKSSDEAASCSQENSNVLPRTSSLQNLTETMRDHQTSFVPDLYLDNTRDKSSRNCDAFDQGENRQNIDSDFKKSTLGHFDQVLNTQILNADADQDIRLRPLPYDLPTERDGASLVNVSIPFCTPSYQEPFKTSQCITQQSTANLKPTPLLQLSGQQTSHAHSISPGYLLGCQANKSNPDADSSDSSNDSNMTSLCNERSDASYHEDDLTKSQLFSHEEAESLYLSAISYINPGEQTGENLPELSPRISGASSTPDVTLFSQMKLDEGITPNNTSNSFESSLPTQGHSVNEASGIERAFSPLIQNYPQINQNRKYSNQFESSENGLHTSEINAGESSELAKQIIDIKYIRIYVPSVEPTNSDGVKPSPYSPSASSSLDISAGFTPSSMPGAFGLNSMNLEAQPEAKEKSSKTVPKEPPTDTRKQRDGIEVEIGRTSIQFDLSVGTLILKVYDHVMSMIKYDSTKQSSKQNKSSTDVLFRLKSDEIFVNFLENLGCNPPIGGYRESDQRMADTLLQARLNGLNVKYHSCEHETRLSMTLRKFLFGYKEESILSFTTDNQLRPSTRDLETSSNVQISAQITRTPNSFRCEIKTLPIQLTINLEKLDEVFSWFGGLSTVLNLGSSIASNTTIAAEKANARCVRFEGPITPETTSDFAEKKVDIRIAGFNLELEGSQCSLSLTTSPHLHQSNDEPAITVDITSTRIEFLSSPKNSDLDRLLSLITPSKTKYGHDDDIILDTLLLQRRKGALLRISIDELKTDIGKLNELNYLPEVWEEISRLASVAKYLPDDDRPGLLSLVSIQKINFHVDSNHVLGDIDLSISDLEVAQITLPALLAFSVGNLSVRRNTVEKLIEKAKNQITPEPGVRVPIIMARIIGNEMEPVIRIKMRNLNVEYRLSVLTALVEFIKTFVSQESLASASASLAELTNFNREIGSMASLQRTRLLSTGESAKQLAVDIDFRNCVLSLNPLEAPSKMLLVLTEAHLNVILPRYDSADILLELGKVSILIIDDVVNLTRREESLIRNQNFHDKINHVSHFCAMGYVSVGYISSTRAKLQIRNCEEQNVDVEVCDALIVLESCADSTKTLIDIVKGLIPLTVVSNEESKYRTKVVPVDDLLSSLSADAFGTAEGDYNFDDDFCFDENSELELPAVEFEESEDFSFGSQYLHHKLEKV